MAEDRCSAEQYADDVLSGKIPACKWTRLAVKRHRQNLQRQNTEDFPYYFDEYTDKPDSAKGNRRIIDFFHHHVPFVQGERATGLQYAELEPWQQFFLWDLFGWRRASDGLRKYNVAYLSVAKKNGKSFLDSGVGLYMMRFDGEPGAEVYTAATTRDQATIIFGVARQMAKKSPFLQKHIHAYKHALVHEETFSSMKALSADADTLDGKNVHCALIDEYHAHPTDAVYDIMKRGTIARKQPLILATTTAGFDLGVPCFEEEEYAKAVLEGRFTNESYYALIYTLDDPDTEWMDESAWPKANPNLGVSIGVKAIRDEFVKAKDRPAEINKFKTKHMNIWTQTESVWITDDKWMACGFEVDPEALAGRPCWAGLDLSVNTDITAFVAAFAKDDSGVSAVVPMFFIPSEAMAERERRDKVPYSLWVEQGHVIATPGDYIDYNYVMEHITEFAARYQLHEVAYDPAYAAQLSIDLTNRGVNMVEFRQGWVTMSPAILEFEKKVLARELAHGGNPVLRWMMQCTTLRQNERGNFTLKKPDRQASSKRIDGTIASVMAVARLVQNTEFGSVYEQRGVILV